MNGEENRCDDHRNDADQLDENVEAGTAGIFERIADGIAGHRSHMHLFIGVPVFFVAAVLDLLLRVVPCATRVGLEDSHADTTDGATDEQTTEHVDVDQSDNDRGEYGDQSRDDHLLYRSCSGDLHAMGVLGLVISGVDDLVFFIGGLALFTLGLLGRQ